MAAREVAHASEAAAALAAASAAAETIVIDSEVTVSAMPTPKSPTPSAVISSATACSLVEGAPMATAGASRRTTCICTDEALNALLTDRSLARRAREPPEAPAVESTRATVQSSVAAVPQTESLVPLRSISSASAAVVPVGGV